MPVVGGIHLPTHLRGDAISPCGLHCVAARCGATITSLLRSLLDAVRELFGVIGLVDLREEAVGAVGVVGEETVGGEEADDAE